MRNLEAIDATHFSAILETHVAYLRFKFKAEVELTQLSPPELIEAKVEGTPFGIVGRLTAITTTRLSETSGQTTIHYSVDATITGKLGSMGQPVLKAKAKDMEKHFTERLVAAFAVGGRGTAQ